MFTKLHTKSYSNNDRLFFLLNPNDDIAENDPVRIVDAVVESLDLKEFKKLYRERGRCPYHPKMMLKIILYAYMNNIYSCRKIERVVQRDIHYIWLAAQERPVFGQMKFNMAYRRFRHFGKDKVTMDFAFFAIAFNLKKMCSKIAKQAKNGGNTPHFGLFMLLSRILYAENRIFWKITKKSVA